MRVCFADAVMLRMVAILDISHAPGAVAYKLESRAAFTLLVAFEANVVVVVGLAPAIGEMFARSRVDTWLATFLLDEHVVETVGRKVVDIRIDGSISPVEEQLGCGYFRKRTVGMAVIHTVVLLFGAVEHGVIDKVSTFFAVAPCIVGIPEDLRSPHAVDRGPVLIRLLRRSAITEDGGSFSEVEGRALPVDKVFAFEQINAIVVPFVTSAHTHISGHHEVALLVGSACDISVACAAFYLCELIGIEDSVATEDVLIVVTVPAHGISRPFSPGHSCGSRDSHNLL